MKRYIADIIIFGIFFLLILLLVGCTKQEPVSNTIADNAITATTALEQSLPVECKAEPIVTQITIIKTQIRAIKNACETEKTVINEQKLKWKLGFWGLIGLIVAYIFKRLTK